MARIFFSYSHKDEALRDQLETHLAMLKRQGFIEAWHDRRITAGTQLDRSISTQLEAADIILLLVSPDFLASDYCYDREVMRAMERHEAGDATVIPIILRPCDWQEAPFGKLLAAPKDAKPVTQWPDVDAALLDVTLAIKAALKKHGSEPAKTPTIQQGGNKVTSGSKDQSEIRSSNLRVAKKFTDRDKEEFLHFTFEYIAKFFENSLFELSYRNPGIEGKFRRIDANRFTAVVYRDGKSVSRCGVFLATGRAGPFGGICYSNDDSDVSTSYNENLSVESDNQALFLKPLGMSRIGKGERTDHLSQEGAAELFWELFIEPLQY